MGKPEQIEVTPTIEQQLLAALIDLCDAVKWRHLDADNLDRAHNAAAAVIAAAKK